MANAVIEQATAAPGEKRDDRRCRAVKRWRGNTYRCVHEAGHWPMTGHDFRTREHPEYEQPENG